MVQLRKGMYYLLIFTWNMWYNVITISSVTFATFYKHLVFTILTNLSSVTVQYWIFVGEKHMLLIFFSNRWGTFSWHKIYIYIYILQTRHFSILFCFVYLFLLIHPSHIKYTTSVVYLGCKPNAVLLLPFFNIEQKIGQISE